MALVSLVAVKEFAWKGRTYQPGEYFTAERKESLRHRLKRVAKPANLPEPIGDNKPKRRYRRKDLQAEE